MTKVQAKCVNNTLSLIKTGLDAGGVDTKKYQVQYVKEAAKQLFQGNTSISSQKAVALQKHKISHSSYGLALLATVIGALIIGAVATTLAAPALAAATVGAAIVWGLAGITATMAIGVVLDEGKAALLESINQAISSDDGMILKGSPNVFIEGKAVARSTDIIKCNIHYSSPVMIATGSDTVFVNGLAIARIDDKSACGGVLTEGAKSVISGGGTVTVTTINNEFSASQQLILIAVEILVPFGIKSVGGAIKSNLKGAHFAYHSQSMFKKGDTLVKVSTGLKAAGKRILRNSKSFSVNNISTAYKGARNAFNDSRAMLKVGWSSGISKPVKAFSAQYGRNNSTVLNGIKSGAKALGKSSSRNNDKLQIAIKSGKPLKYSFLGSCLSHSKISKNIIKGAGKVKKIQLINNDYKVQRK